MSGVTLRRLVLAIIPAAAVLATGCGGSRTSTIETPLIGPGAVSATSNPLVASYSLTVPAGASVRVRFGLDTQYGLETWSQPAGAGGAVTILVAGMRPSTTYHLQAVATLSDGSETTDSDHAFTTGALPAGFSPSISVATTPGMTPQSGVELLDLLSPNGSSPHVNVAATDLNGDVIWYYDAGTTATVPEPVKLLPDGNVLIDYDNQGEDGSNSVLEEITLAGDVVWKMTSADLNQALSVAGYDLTIIGTHHAVALLPNGHMILIASTSRDFTDLPGYPGTTAVLGDVLIDLDENRKPVWTWSGFDHLDVNRHPLQFPDWMHSNAILYSPDDGNLLLSVRHQDWLLKIDYENGAGSGDLLWKLGWQGDFALQGGADPIDWFYAQHGPNFVSSNSSGVFQLVLFDNGDARNLNSSANICGVATACFSRVPIFQVDEMAKTATIQWQDTPLTYSAFGGYSQVLANDNVEFDECAVGFAPPMAAIYEVTQDPTPKTVWQMLITGQWAYRAFRIPSLYPGVQW